MICRGVSLIFLFVTCFSLLILIRSIAQFLISGVRTIEVILGTELSDSEPGLQENSRHLPKCLVLAGRQRVWITSLNWKLCTHLHFALSALRIQHGLLLRIKFIYKQRGLHAVAHRSARRGICPTLTRGYASAHPAPPAALTSTPRASAPLPHWAPSSW